MMENCQVFHHLCVFFSSARTFKRFFPVSICLSSLCSSLASQSPPEPSKLAMALSESFPTLSLLELGAASSADDKDASSAECLCVASSDLLPRRRLFSSLELDAPPFSTLSTLAPSAFSASLLAVGDITDLTLSSRLRARPNTSLEGYGLSSSSGASNPTAREDKNGFNASVMPVTM